MATSKIIPFLCFAFVCGILNASVFEYKELDADKIIYDVKSGDIKTGGQTKITGQTGQKITLQDAYLDKKNAEGKDVVIQWNENTLMTADVFKKDGPLTRAENVSYTACNNCDDVGTAWTLHATDVTHDAEEKYMYFYNFWFDAYGVPLLYMPFWSQPDPTVKHKSGFLIPELGSSTNNGTKVDIPLYITFSDNHDMTLTGSFFSRENPLIGVEHRLILNHANFDTVGSYTNTMNKTNRWHFFHDDVIDVGENMRFTAKIQRTSDKTYLQQYDLYADQPFLESTARLEIFAKNGYTTVGTNIFQELRQRVETSNEFVPKGNILPRVHGTYQFGLADDLYTQVSGDVMRISDERNNSVTNRAIGEFRVIAPVETMWQKFTMSAAVRNDYYNYDNVDGAVTNEATRMLPSGYIDWEMPFVKSGEGLTQVIKPKARLTMLGKSDDDKFVNIDCMESKCALLSDASLFVNNRYSGYDMWVNGTYADYGLSWTGYNSDGQSAEVFVGQTYDFNTKDEVDINSGYGNGASDIVGRVVVNPTESVGLTNRFRLSKDNGDLMHLETDLRLGNRNYVNAGYIWAVKFSEDVYVRSNISEGVLGTGFYMTKLLSIRAQGVYNFTDGVPQRYNAGIYYEHPCYLLGLVYSVDNAIKVVSSDSGEDINFKGVTSLKLKFSIKIGA